MSVKVKYHRVWVYKSDEYFHSQFALDEVYFFFGRKVTHFDAHVPVSMNAKIKLQTFKYTTVDLRILLEFEGRGEISN